MIACRCIFQSSKMIVHVSVFLTHQVPTWIHHRAIHHLVFWQTHYHHAIIMLSSCYHRLVSNSTKSQDDDSMTMCLSNRVSIRCSPCVAHCFTICVPGCQRMDTSQSKERPLKVARSLCTCILEMFGGHSSVLDGLIKEHASRTRIRIQFRKGWLALPKIVVLGDATVMCM